MTITITINTDNDAVEFLDQEELRYNLELALLKSDIQTAGDKLRDFNGNSIGTIITD